MALVFIKGDDQVLLAQEVNHQISALVGNGDKSLMVEEVTETEFLQDNGLNDIGVLINASQTPPFLTERRVVVGRNLGLFSKKDQIQPLAGVLEKDLGPIDLVLVWEKGGTSTRLSAVPKLLKDALKNAGAEMIDAAPKGKALKASIQEKLDMAPVKLDQSARNVIVNTIGDNLGQLDSLFETLVSTYGLDSKVGADKVSPFLGDKSDIPPWDLTDAIDSGNIVLAIENLQRMVSGGDKHPLQIMSVLHGHYQKALALDGAGVTNEKEAANLLGMKGSTFPAKKALNLTKKLGNKKVCRAIDLLSKADLDIRGETALEPIAVTEVLVARLAQMSK